MKKITSMFACATLVLFLSTTVSQAGFKQSNEKFSSANDVWGLDTTRGVRLSSKKAKETMTIDTRHEYLNKTVAPRIPMIQNNRELLRTMPTCFDPEDPARIPWYGNVKDNTVSGSGGGGGSTTISKSASWTFEIKLRDWGYPNAIVPNYSATADFPAESASYTVNTTYPVYPEGDPAIPSGCSIISPCPLYFVISVTFSSTDPTLSPLDACALSGVSFTHDSSESSSSLYTRTTISQHPSCANGMTLMLSVAQPFLCGMTDDDETDCASVLSAFYTINANWTETSTEPPPEDDTILHEPVIYSYDPKECSRP